MSKSWWMVIIGFCLLCGVLFGTRQYITRYAIQSIGMHFLGVDIDVKHIKFAWNKPVIQLSELTIGQPEGIEDDSDLIHVKHMSVEYQQAKVIRGQYHLTHLEMDIDEIILVKNANGVLNVDLLKVAQEESQSVDQVDSFDFKVDQLELSLRKVIIKDFTKGDDGRMKVYNLDIEDKVLENITGFEQLASVLFMEAMMSSALEGAKMSGVATLAGAGFLPAGVVGFLITKDHAETVVHDDSARVFQVLQEKIQGLGVLRAVDPENGWMRATVDKHVVSITWRPMDEGIKIVVSARLMLVPKPQKAEKILYELTRELAR